MNGLEMMLKTLGIKIDPQVITKMAAIAEALDAKLTRIENKLDSILLVAESESDNGNG